MFQVNFINQNKSIPVEGGTVAEACKAAGFPLNLVCGGNGTCGKCKVTIQCGEEKQEVLACKTDVKQDMTIFLEEKDISRQASILTESAERPVTLTPAISKEYKTRKELMPEHCGACLEAAPLPVMRKFAAWFNDPECEGMTLIRHQNKLIDVQKGDTTRYLYGGAIDIGSTSVVLYIYDLHTGKCLATQSELNRQIAHGADVITRIMYASESPENLAELNQNIMDTIRALLTRAGEKVPGLADHLYHLVLCGNSTMQHLFLKLNPEALGVSPFVNITSRLVVSNAETVGLKVESNLVSPAGESKSSAPADASDVPINPTAIIEFLPLLGGFVGADTTSVLLTLPQDQKKYLMIDLGTNGELAVGNSENYLTSSTACGPALEGGNMECGMRGTIGAIEKVKIENDELTIKVIGDAEPLGICGSGIIDTTAQLLLAGIIDDSGRLLPRDEYEEEHPGSPLANRLKKIDGCGNAFILSDGEKPVFFCKKDVRQLQLAKSSIYSGCVTLLAESDLTPNDVDELVLAGAFGSYIDIDNALTIGLLPPVPRDRIHSIGNGAGLGVCLYLLDKDYRKFCLALPAHTTHLELASCPMFMEEYVDNMDFPEV